MAYQSTTLKGVLKKMVINEDHIISSARNVWPNLREVLTTYEVVFPSR